MKIALYDFLICRVSKLQDNRGPRLFKPLPGMLEEDISGFPMIDNLFMIGKMEAGRRYRRMEIALAHKRYGTTGVRLIQV